MHIIAEKFYADPTYRHQHYLRNGQPIKDMGSAHLLHERTKMDLVEALIHWKALLDPKLNAVIAAECPYQFNPYTVLMPDVSIQIPVRKLNDCPTYPQGSPEVVIEILSPSTTMGNSGPMPDSIGQEASGKGGHSILWTICFTPLPSRVNGLRENDW